jgi:hypothetical protein
MVLVKEEIVSYFGSLKQIVNGDTFRSELTSMNIEISGELEQDFVIILYNYNY